MVPWSFTIPDSWTHFTNSSSCMYFFGSWKRFTAPSSCPLLWRARSRSWSLLTRLISRLSSGRLSACGGIVTITVNDCYDYWQWIKRVNAVKIILIIFSVMSFTNVDWHINIHYTLWVQIENWVIDNHEQTHSHSLAESVTFYWFNCTSMADNVDVLALFNTTQSSYSWFRPGLTCDRSPSGRESTNDLTIWEGKISESVL